MNLSEAEKVLLYGPDLWCGKMSPEHSVATKVQTSEQSCKKPSASYTKKPPLFLYLKTDGQTQDAYNYQTWQDNAVLRGEFSMHSFGEYPSVDVESHLSQILEECVPEKYYLSAKACQGILRRADRRGKQLPPMLKTALYEMIAYWERKEQEILPLTIKVRCGTHGNGGRGVLIQTDQSATLSVFQNQALFQPCDAALTPDIGCMATQQGGAEICEDNKVSTITAVDGMSGNNQPVICIQGNCIDRADTAGCNGKGWTEDVSYTLNTIDRPAVAVVAEMGGGDKQ